MFERHRDLLVCFISSVAGNMLTATFLRLALVSSRFCCGQSQFVFLVSCFCLSSVLSHDPVAPLLAVLAVRVIYVSDFTPIFLCWMFVGGEKKNLSPMELVCCKHRQFRNLTFVLKSAEAVWEESERNAVLFPTCGKNKGGCCETDSDFTKSAFPCWLCRNLRVVI